ncbi:MAG: hypothetical protein HY841_04030 [Bacteroidetes bacterium]|nr:hypothetical protein [Bacteroidota bacterium]
MNIFAILEGFKEYEYVKYYTVRLIKDEQKDESNEADKFYKIYRDPAHSHHSEYKIILKVIDAIGYHYRGAEPYLFRFEDKADALPPPRKSAKNILDIEIVMHSELRLYCIRLSNEVVVLLNGGVKTRDQALNCPNVSGHFRFAQTIAKLIDDLIARKEIRIEGKEIINETGEEEIIFYN